MYTLFADSTAPTSLAGEEPFTNELSTRTKFDDSVTFNLFAFDEETSSKTV